MYPRPCDHELGNAVVEIDAVPAVVVERRLAVNVPTSETGMKRQFS